MAVTLYVVRHGHAEMHAPSDPERPLSETGQAEAKKAAQLLKGVHPDLILVSPYLRAQQTAKILIREANLATKITTEKQITPDDNPVKVAELLAEQSAGTLVVVSHNPLVSALVSWLVEGHFQGHYAMGTASVACIELEVISPGQGHLKWLKHVN